MNKIELNDFYNDCFGWICRHCEREFGEDGAPNRSRLMSEGEAESKQPRMSNRALVKWADRAQTTLLCPNCGIVEAVDNF